jgi:hypothetical protein
MAQQTARDVDRMPSTNQDHAPTRKQTPAAAGSSSEKGLPPYFSIPELADRWRCSRASVYNRIRGEKVVDFAAKGRKGHKVVPLETVLRIEQAHLRVLR